jgi:hypothetical protein
MLLVAAAAGADCRPAQAADCITEPNVPAPDGTHWSPHWELNNYRRCWVLVDAAGREVVASVPAKPASPSGTQATPASPAAASPHKPHTPQPDGPHRVVAASKPAARSEPPKSGLRPAKRDMSQLDRAALYEEFLRWHESQKIIGAK